MSQVFFVVCSYMYLVTFVMVSYPALICTETDRYKSHCTISIQSLYCTYTCNLRDVIFSHTLFLSSCDTHSCCLRHHVILTRAIYGIMWCSLVLFTSSCDTHSCTVYVIIRYSLTDCLRLLMWSLKSSKRLKDIWTSFFIYTTDRNRLRGQISNT